MKCIVVGLGIAPAAWANSYVSVECAARGEKSLWVMTELRGRRGFSKGLLHGVCTRNRLAFRA